MQFFPRSGQQQLHKNVASCIEQVLEATLRNSSCTDTYQPSQKLSKLNELDMRNTAGEVKMNS